VLLLAGFVFVDGSCQTGDSLGCDTNNYTIIFNCIPTFNGKALSDGDIINVLSNITDVESQTNSIQYNRDSLNAIPLSGSLLLDALPDNTNLIFSVNSKTNSCISKKIEFITDNINSSACILSISSFQAVDHTIAYEYDSFCPGDQPILPFSDIPENDYAVSSFPDGLKINSNGEILPGESLPGKYRVNFISDYCLSTDSAEVEILPSVSSSLRDTLSVCTGSNFDDLGTSISNIRFYSSDRSDSYTGNELSASGDYIAVAEQSPCPSIDTVYVNLIELPEILLDTQQACDRVIVNTIIPADRSYSVTWSNRAEGPTTTVYYDTVLFVDVENESGCISRDSVVVEVKRLALQSLHFQKEEADCWKEGRLSIETGEVYNNVGNYHYRLQNKLTNQLISTLDEVPEGIYSVQVVDDRDCVAEYKDPIEVVQKCLEDYPAFTPNGDNIEDNYFIPHEGTVSIYNREGMLVRKLATPAYWDGTDEQNRLLPMGNYLLITDTGRSVNITIIR
jgi:hypothetical protein